MSIMWFVLACSFILYLVSKFALYYSFGKIKLSVIKIYKNHPCFIIDLLFNVVIWCSNSVEDISYNWTGRNENYFCLAPSSFWSASLTSLDSVSSDAERHSEQELPETFLNNIWCFIFHSINFQVYKHRGIFTTRK